MLRVRQRKKRSSSFHVRDSRLSQPQCAAAHTAQRSILPLLSLLSLTLMPLPLAPLLLARPIALTRIPPLALLLLLLLRLVMFIVVLVRLVAIPMLILFLLLLLLLLLALPLLVLALGLLLAPVLPAIDLAKKIARSEK